MFQTSDSRHGSLQYEMAIHQPLAETRWDAMIDGRFEKSDSKKEKEIGNFSTHATSRPNHVPNLFQYQPISRDKKARLKPHFAIE
jgi:hypothetical protein